MNREEEKMAPVDRGGGGRRWPQSPHELDPTLGAKARVVREWRGAIRVEAWSLAHWSSVAATLLPIMADSAMACGGRRRRREGIWSGKEAGAKRGNELKEMNRRGTTQLGGIGYMDGIWWVIFLNSQVHS